MSRALSALLRTRRVRTIVALASLLASPISSHAAETPPYITFQCAKYLQSAAFEIPPYRMLITHPISVEGMRKMGLKPIAPPDWLRPIVERFRLTQVHFGMEEGRSILYLPEISSRQIIDEVTDPMIDAMGAVLEVYRPEVLVLGNNAAPKSALATWRRAAPRSPLLVIRRGVDTRAIDKRAADQAKIMVGNLPGVNSPFVAKSMIEKLGLNQAKRGDRIAVIGVGNIGQPIVEAAKRRGLKIALYSPSLANPLTREASLLEKGIEPQDVIVGANLDESLRGAKFVAVSIPYEDANGKRLDGYFTLDQMKSLADRPTIVSCSVPGTFSPDALRYLDDLAAKSLVKFHVSTAKRHALEVHAKYPHLSADYDQAFADPECQAALDRCFLNLADNVMFDVLPRGKE